MGFTFPPVPQQANNTKPVHHQPSASDLASLIQMQQQKQMQQPQQQQQQLPPIDLNNTELLYQLVIALNQHIIQKQQHDIQQHHQKQQQHQQVQQAVFQQSNNNKNCQVPSIDSTTAPTNIFNNSGNNNISSFDAQLASAIQLHQLAASRVSPAESSSSRSSSPSPPPGFTINQLPTSGFHHQGGVFEAPVSPDSEPEFNNNNIVDRSPRLPIFNQLTN